MLGRCACAVSHMLYFSVVFILEEKDFVCVRDGVIICGSKYAFYSLSEGIDALTD